ncbi:glutaredoxin [Endozoicomonas sp. SCSIO W0465]|uniref:glutaredoxin family protein n=1 Tax=Endozoicomonas sp. SCSIO W0465 TaxID=2918516 RepID=UPI0020759DB6|nr:glutaredoxin [Endozoicomonas sp. SCSIO W0465]USE36710.1 glutaredoxin [Endozoicomonas sp. SCSIO W0465]
MLLKIIRNVLGCGIVVADKLTRPKAIVRSPEQQARVDAQTANMSLYQFKACPFCVKTRRAIHKLGLNIQTMDAMNDAQARNELQQMGGKIQVPCLRIQEADKDDTWMYESDDIILYLHKQFG